MGEADALAPVARGESELEIVGAERVVGDGGVDDFLKERRIAEEVLRYAEPHAEQLGWVRPGGGGQHRGKGLTGVEQIMWS